MIFDIILGFIFVLLIVINAVRGAGKALAGIISAVISYFASTALGSYLADMVYNAYLRPAITQTITDAVKDAGSGAAATVSDTLPSWLTGLLNISGSDVNNALSQPFSDAGGMIAKAVDDAVQPVAKGILTILFTVILFLIFLIILRLLLRKPLAGLMHLPILNGLNHFLGGVIGFIDAFLLVSMAAYLIRLILSNMTTQSGWFCESTIYNSFIFYHFYSGNIFTWITSWFT